MNVAFVSIFSYLFSHSSKNEIPSPPVRRCGSSVLYRDAGSEERIGLPDVRTPRQSRRWHRR